MPVAAAVKWRDELVEGAEVVVDRRRQFAGRLVAAVRGEVGPEDCVVDVAAEVEREVLLELVHVGEVAGVAGLGELGESGVGSRHVGLVMLVVVQLHDLAADARLERRVVVPQFGESVFSHSLSP